MVAKKQNKYNLILFVAPKLLFKTTFRQLKSKANIKS